MQQRPQTNTARCVETATRTVSTIGRHSFSSLYRTCICSLVALLLLTPLLGSSTQSFAFTVSSTTHVTISQEATIRTDYTNDGTVTHLGTTTFDGDSTRTLSGTMIGESGWNNLIISGTGAVLSGNASTSALGIAPSATLALGTEEASTTQLSITGNLTNLGTLTPNHSTVYLTGADQTLTGSTTFYNLTKVATTTATTTFEAGSKTTITNDWYFTGLASTSRLALRSTIPGTYWYLDPQGTRTLANLDVQDSYNVNDRTVVCRANVSGCYDSEGNINWLIDVPFLSSDSDQQFYAGQSTSTLETITFIEPLTSPTATAVNDIRISIASTTTNFRFDTGATLSFTGTASGKVAPTVSYENNDTVLVIDVTQNFARGDSLVIAGVEAGSFLSISTTTSRFALHTTGDTSDAPSAYDEMTLRITGALTLADHSGGQVQNAFLFLNSTDIPIFAFSLTPTGETATATTLTFTNTTAHKIDASNVTNIRLYRDIDGDRELSAGDIALDSAGSFSYAPGAFGGFVFNEDVEITETADYLVVADIDRSYYASMLSIDLLLESFTDTTFGAVSNTTPVMLGSVTTAEHFRARARITGGTNTLVEPIGGVGPSASTVSGGAGDSGDAITDRNDEEIGNEPGFRAPYVSGLYENEWVNGSQGTSSDGSYATSSTEGARQTYSTFGFNVPGGSTVTGVALRLEASGNASGGTVEVMLSWDGGLSYTTGIHTPILTADDKVYTIGGQGSLWGTSWTPSYFTDGNFVVRVIAHPESNVLRIDALQVRPYSELGGGSPGGGDAI